MPRADRTGGDAGRHPVALVEGLVVDAVDAEGAFLHHPLGLIELARAIGAGPGAELAADAFVFVDQHDPVRRALERSAGRADGDAGRRLAMHAGLGEMHRATGRALARLEGVDAVEPDAVRL